MGQYVRVEWRASIGLIGAVLLYLTLPLLFPLALAVLYGESVLPFLVPMAVTLGLGGGLRMLADIEEDVGPREAFLAVATIWLLVAAIGALPFLVAGNGTIAQPVNAMFEAMSGLTTTGATVIGDFGVHSRSVMMWRQVLQWLGGLGILILVTAVLSEIGVGGAQLMETETQSQSSNRLTPRISETAQLIWGLYLGLTVLVAAVLAGMHYLGPVVGVELAPNMNLYNAVAHALTSISTAGFSPEARSIEAFSAAVQWVLIPVMLLGSTSFVLIYFAIRGAPMRLLRSEEFRFYIGVFALFTATSAALLIGTQELDMGLHDTVRHSAFNVASILTTTGYASQDFTNWPNAGQNVLFAAMFIGGMVGSTTCSIKSLRWLVVLKSFRRDLFTAIHPDAVRPVRVSGSSVDEGTIRDIYGYVLLSIVIFFLLTLFVVIDGARSGVDPSEFEAMGAAASTVLNIGPAFGRAGPMDNYLVFPESTRAVMVVLMWLGRIEIVPVLVLLTPSFWRS
ncbi:MAG: Trk-type K+ transport system, membrane component [halophilic archaeon J07HX64]|jgi:Trk-type K+ transport systems, membrane components|nr:MAG: Trk-type K+ transport system, membrane component [halophilic archaeon J07HX64]